MARQLKKHLSAAGTLAPRTTDTIRILNEDMSAQARRRLCRLVLMFTNAMKPLEGPTGMDCQFMGLDKETLESMSRMDIMNSLFKNGGDLLRRTTPRPKPHLWSSQQYDYLSDHEDEDGTTYKAGTEVPKGQRKDPNTRSKGATEMIRDNLWGMLSSMPLMMKMTTRSVFTEAERETAVESAQLAGKPEPDFSGKVSKSDVWWWLRNSAVGILVAKKDNSYRPADRLNTETLSQLLRDGEAWHTLDLDTMGQILEGIYQVGVREFDGHLDGIEPSLEQARRKQNQAFQDLFARSENRNDIIHALFKGQAKAMGPVAGRPQHPHSKIVLALKMMMYCVLDEPTMTKILGNQTNAITGKTDQERKNDVLRQLTQALLWDVDSQGGRDASIPAGKSVMAKLEPLVRTGPALLSKGLLPEQLSERPVFVASKGIKSRAVSGLRSAARAVTSAVTGS